MTLPGYSFICHKVAASDHSLFTKAMTVTLFVKTGISVKTFIIKQTANRQM